jgi:hypothetical protein
MSVKTIARRAAKLSMAGLVSVPVGVVTVTPVADFFQQIRECHEADCPSAWLAEQRGFPLPETPPESPVAMPSGLKPAPTATASASDSFYLALKYIAPKSS